MKTGERIYVAGHRGMVGSALVRALTARGHADIVTRTHAELDLTSQEDVQRFFAEQKPRHVFLAAARVGGIIANQSLPARFIHENLAIQTNVIHAAHEHGVERLLFLGSSCIYPKEAPQPIKEEYLLTGPLEATNRAYALAKIAGIEMCWSYNRQYGARFLAAMPCNLYGPGDNYHPEHSHVIPALIRKAHEAKVSGARAMTVWGSGEPRREFLYSDDMADACVFLMNLPDEVFNGLLGRDEVKSGRFSPPVVNIGAGADLTIRELVREVCAAVGYDGAPVFDASRPDGTMRKLMDSSRLTKLGWTPRKSLAEGLQQAYTDFVRLTAAVR
jgi:GDP-L-fucose synthase